MDRSRIRRNTLDPARPFDFSQASLQDFQDCARRFQLRYLEQRKWPAPQAEPIRENEAAIQRGERFHRLAQQALLGIPPDLLAQAAQADPDPQLAQWWAGFAALLPALQAGHGAAETLLAAPLGTPTSAHRLLAKYDFIQILEDKVIIYDWKTTPHRPRRAALEERLQTIVYPYLLTLAGAGLNGGQTIPPERIEMVYWFTAFPDQPERFAYSAARQKRDGQRLRALIDEVAALPAEGFVKTEETKRCKFCVYRSLCARGVEAGSLEDLEDDEESAAIEIDFEQIGEISF